MLKIIDTMPYYIDNITETIKTIKNKIINKKDLFYVFPNDIENIMEYNKLTKEICISKLIPNYTKEYKIKTFDTSSSNMMSFVIDYFNFIDNLKTITYIQTPLINVNNIVNDNYFVDNYLPFVITKFIPSDKSEIIITNKTKVLLQREDYFKELFLLYDYVNKNNFFGETFTHYNNRYNDIISKFI